MKKTLLGIVILFIAIQFIRLEKTNPPIDENIALHAPTEVEAILRRSCYDCHSFETKWPSYADIAPISWSVISHVNDGRKAFNFSEWKNIDPTTKAKRLKRAIKTTRNGMMPLPNYLKFHDEAILNDADKKILEDWCMKEIEKCTM